MNAHKISQLGLTGRKLIIEGLFYLVVGGILLLFNTWLPLILIRLFLWLLIGSSIFDIVFSILKKVSSREPFWMIVMKLVISVWLLRHSLAIEFPIWFVVIIMGIYQLFIAFISAITFYIYVKDGIHPRSRLLWDTIWLTIIGISSLTSVTTTVTLQMWILGIYSLRVGYTNIRDGLFFESEIGKKVIRRKIRVGLPLAVAALTPRLTLQKINDYLAMNDDLTAPQVYNLTKDSGRKPNLELFIHVSEKGFGAIGHVDLCYQNRVISFGNYDTNSERFFGMMGDGVLFEVDREQYIDFCKKENHQTLLGYGLSLNEQQLAEVEQQIVHLKSMTIPWIPEKMVRPKKSGEKEELLYAYLMMEETDANFYKFTRSKFKTYFVLSTNCVLLADSIVGKAGTDILSLSGFIAPGTYQRYLDKEFEKPYSMVVAKQIYQ